jgi:tetratricopeptide (TPR) repeat protein
VEDGERVIAKREWGDRMLLPAVMAVLLAAATWPGAARGEDPPAPSATRATVRTEEARRLREKGDEHASRDRPAEAIRAYQAAVAADPSLGPEIAPSLGAQLLWAGRTAEALPILEAAAARNPADRETRKLLALAYRWSDRLDEAECLSRKTLTEVPGDLDERNGLAVALLWQGRNRQAAAEFERVLAARPDEFEALLGLSRARMELDLPEEAEGPAARAVAMNPKNREATEQLARVRRRLRRYVEGEVRASYDTDELSRFDLSLGVHARAARGLDIGVVGRELFFRQGSPGKDVNIDQADSANGTAGSLLFAYRPGAFSAFRGSAGLSRYDVDSFRPWTGSAGVTFFPGDLWRMALDWERAPYDTILSLQNHLTVDTITAGVARWIPWKTEVSASAALLFHHNRNDVGQARENSGERFELGFSRRLYLKGDVTRLTGLARLSWLGFRKSLDVGAYNPRRQTAEEVGLDGRWAFRPRWEAFGTAMGGAQQEKGAGGSPTYSLETGVDREVGAAGRITLGGFIADSSAVRRGEGYRRQGGYLRFRVPF